MKTLQGQCMCTAITYTVTDEFSYALICHCSLCRRSTGAANKPFAGIEIGKLRVTNGQDCLQTYGDENASDHFCKKCGSLLYSIVRDGAYAHVTMGTLIDDPTIRPSAHIFVGSKAPWEIIADGLPQHDEGG